MTRKVRGAGDRHPTAS